MNNSINSTPFHLTLQNWAYSPIGKTSIAGLTGASAGIITYFKVGSTTTIALISAVAIGVFVRIALYYALKALSNNSLIGKIKPQAELNDEQLLDQLKVLCGKNYPNIYNEVETAKRNKSNSLDLSSKIKCNTIPGEVFSLINQLLPNLKTLDLSNNGLTSLPTEIGQLTQLQKLWIQHNQITSLPTEIGQLTQLQNLWIDHNKLTSLPTEIGQLKLLQNLWIDNNQLESIPTEIGLLTQLHELRISFNKLTSLPTEIGQLTQLHELWISHNQLTSLPTEIGLLTQLQKLCIASNKLKSLPTEIGQLTQLHELWIFCNKLKSLPTEMGNLQHLNSLSLQHNPELEELPLSLGQLANITNLESEGTKLNPDQVNTILESCKAQRIKEAHRKLPSQISLWLSYSNSKLNLSAYQKLTDSDKNKLYDWLIRLQKTSDFKNNQQELATIVCSILETVIHNQSFKETFFAQVISDQEGCGDRAAMSLNILYTFWLIETFDQEKGIIDQEKGIIDQEKRIIDTLNRYLALGRTLALRNELTRLIHNYEEEIHSEFGEKVETYLYYESELKEELELLSATKGMLYKSIGPREWIELEGLKSVVKETCLKCLIHEVPQFTTFVKEHHSEHENQIEALKSRLNTDLERAEEQEEKREINGGEYLRLCNSIQAQRKDGETEIFKNWIASKVTSHKVAVDAVFS